MRNLSRMLLVQIGLLLCIPFVGYADISTVKYVHDTILNAKELTVPIDSNINPNSPNSVRYLLEQIDTANAMRGKPTSYATGELSRTNIVATTQVNRDVDELIVDASGFQVKYSGIIAGDSVSFKLSAAGSFSVSWGDGTIDVLERAQTGNEVYSHTYASGGDYTVIISGTVTSYYVFNSVGTFSFYNCTNNTKITAIKGDLGKLFPPINGTGPRFYRTFHGCNGITGPIPSDLFASVSVPMSRMFQETFYGCYGLTGQIPADLFAGVVGAPTDYMFYKTFQSCSQLTGAIPSGLFSRINGAPAVSMFESTFQYCYGITRIQSNVFGAFTGNPAARMFAYTFETCANIVIIEDGIWDLSGLVDVPKGSEFFCTFRNCANIESASPSIKANSSVKLWTYLPSLSGYTFGGCTKMADFADVPEAWR